MTKSLKRFINIGNILYYRQSQMQCRVFSSQKEKFVEKRYSDTVILPKTNFQAKIHGKKRIEMDQYIKDKCGFSELYNWQRANLKGPDFVLHDGPPYANGDPHMGHTINKILKDITIRSKVIKGQRVHYIPGWDCHGLPIELKALSSTKKNNYSDLSPLQIRAQARKFAEEAICKQRQIFASWGIMADWKDTGCYFTYNPDYVKNQFRQFYNLYQKNLVYRDFKPVYVSPSTRTALAESELEYKDDHQSLCATVRLLLVDLPEKLASFGDKPIYALTWTTTPWTLVANQALSYCSNAKYCLAKDYSSNLYILASDLITSNQEKIGPLSVLKTFMGYELFGTTYAHPITGEVLPFLAGNHVNTEQGTGLVHTAPAHGQEDFLVALENKIAIKSFVNEDGKYNAQAGPDFEGISVLEQGTNAVIAKIGQDILNTETITHSYPYDWRTKKPVIVLASYQWFIDTNSIKDKAIECVQKINIYPEQNRVSWKNALVSQLQKRPYWCISRQRVWGTPIPVLFYKGTNKVFISGKWIDRLEKLVNKYGNEFWWELPIEKLLGQKLIAELNVEPSSLEKGNDILDIWFDSGVSWSTVLTNKKANLYMEGMDQFNGWFQSSLLTSVALQECSPYDDLFVHGFAVDDKNNKMSKSIGNVINPELITKGGKDINKNPVYGIDVLRWWVASHGTQHTLIPMKNTLLQGSADTIHKFRLVFKFLLGALQSNYEIKNSMVEPQYKYLDKYMLYQLYHYHHNIQSMYEKYQYHNVSRTIVNFITNDVSAIYCHLIKDRIYCEKSDSPYRLGALDVIAIALAITVRSIAPILPHLAEEIWLHHPENLTSVPLFHVKQNIMESWNNSEAKIIVARALDLKNEINKIISFDKHMNNPWLLKATVEVNSEDYKLLSMLQNSETSCVSELCDICQLSSITLLKNNSIKSMNVTLNKIENQHLCKRCRRYPESGNEEICNRCSEILCSI
ncbi:isoleucine--tRNA ligase, mitochondrial isoform X1 [Trichogramma pretiosum]|uniref:isoleucine--tRNA ligase, mitochondrial isoform X1 n=2 Tax=Trichogramma pretiosum TaxID=7493 RepID=UPI0006C94134|nr:isoleucine--tRNA ligase, mitochondrial isoform X1 [Trichogramma pretiosum]